MQRMLKTQNLRFESKICCLKFSENIFCVLDAILLPQQCFLFCAAIMLIFSYPPNFSLLSVGAGYQTRDEDKEIDLESV